jgi:hypothetical protein
MARLRTPRPSPLSAETIAILLGGWSCHPPAGQPRCEGFGGGFLALCEVDGPATLWRQHEPYLRTVAAEWGWSPTFTIPGVGLAYYGEVEAASRG